LKDKADITQVELGYIKIIEDYIDSKIDYEKQLNDFTANQVGEFQKATRLKSGAIETNESILNNPLFLDAKAKVEKIKAAQRLAEQRLKEDRAKFEPIKDSEAMQVYRDYLIRMRDAFRQVGDDGEGLSADGETVVKLNAEERLRKYDQAAGVKSAIDLLDRMCNR